MTKNTGTDDLSMTTASRRHSRLRQVGALMRHRGPWRSLAALSLVTVATTALATPSTGPLSGAQTVDVAHAVSLSEVWGTALPDNGGPIALSSPNVADLAGGPAVVVGDRAGHVYAMNLATGNEVPGWPVSTGGVPVDSTPSVVRRLDSVFVGVGNASNSHVGGYMGITPRVGPNG